MGSRSKNNRKRQMAKMGDGSDIGAADFWEHVLAAIEIAEENPRNLSWSGRALLVTRFRSRLHDFCKTHGLGVADGYISAIELLVKGEQLAFFEADAIKKIKRILSEIIEEAQSLRAADQAFLNAMGFPAEVDK